MEHNNHQKVSTDSIPFPAGIITVNTSVSESSEQDDTADLASGEESSTDASTSLSLRPIRGRQISIRPTPYQRTNEDSSRSTSPIHRPSLTTLSPLQISFLLSGHAAPSPLQNLAFSRANSPSPPLLDYDMVVDEAGSPMDEDELSEHPFNDQDVLAKASFAIILLSHIQTLPPAQLLVCTKCQHGINPTSLATHSTLHNIKLLPADKKTLHIITNNSTFLDDSTEIPSPTPPYPPIEGIKIQDGFTCNLCSYCVTKIHFWLSRSATRYDVYNGERV